MEPKNGMYHVIDNYYIVVDEVQYTVCEKLMNKKKGEEYLATLTYHGDLRSAVKSLCRNVLQASLERHGGELKDLVNTYSSETKRLTTALLECFPEIVDGGEKDNDKTD